MSMEAKLREFPHFGKFSAIKQRGNPQTTRASLADERRMSSATELSVATQTLAVSIPHEPSPPRRSPTATGGLALEQILATPRQLSAVEGQQRRESSASYAYGSSAELPLEPAHPLHGLSFYDLPHMLRQLDCSPEDEDDCGSGDRDAHARLSADGVVDQMRTLAGASSAADIATAAQQIMGYLERECRRRQKQSERHHMIAAALADILALSDSPSAVAQSAPPSRRSSGAPRGWSPAHDYQGAIAGGASQAPRPRDADDGHAFRRHSASPASSHTSGHAA
ncbi:hypothetical protein IWQ57_005425, partial [Coemansia nantahalensis]